MTMFRFVVMAVAWSFYYTAVRMQYEVVWIETAKFHYDNFVRTTIQRQNEIQKLEESQIEI